MSRFHWKSQLPKLDAFSSKFELEFYQLLMIIFSFLTSLLSGCCIDCDQKVEKRCSTLLTKFVSDLLQKGLWISVTRLGDFFPKTAGQKFGNFLCYFKIQHSSINNCCGNLLGNFWNFWTILYFYIWSHCLGLKMQSCVNGAKCLLNFPWFISVKGGGGLYARLW